jgi:hypothetical protein
MTGWKVYSIIKMMTFWNYLSDLYNIFKERSQNFYYYLKDYFYGHHDLWLFIPGHSFPLSMSNLNNMIHISWIYDNYDNSLSLSTDKEAEFVHCKLSWLSAKIRIYNNISENDGIEYTIDDFIEKFNVHTTENNVPTLYMVFMCWCAYTKHWFKPTDHIEFHVIDDMGEEVCLTIEDHNESLYIKRNKIYVIVDSGENNEQNEIVNGQSDSNPLIQEKKDKDD